MSFFNFVPNVFFFVPFVIFLSRMLFFILSPACLLILSRFRFFVPVHFFFVPGSQCPKLLTGTRCHFLVMAFEVAGRWSPNAVTFLRNLAWYKSLSVPRVLRYQLVGEASGNVRLCERAGGVRGRFGPPSMHVSEGLGFCEAHVWCLGC